VIYYVKHEPETERSYALREFTGTSLTVYELMRANQRNEVVALVLGRSGVLRLYVLPLSWAEKLEGPYEGWSIDEAQQVTVEDLRKEAVTGQILMEQGSAVITVSRGVPQAILVPANRYWKALVEPEGER
jgi:hypothetical protein